MKRNNVREGLIESVGETRTELFRLRREHAELLDQAASLGLDTPEGAAALRKAGQVGTEMVRALQSYEQALTQLSNFSRQWRPWEQVPQLISLRARHVPRAGKELE